MKKLRFLLRAAGISVVIICVLFCVLFLYGLYDLKNAPSDFYIPGRDTVAHWRDGVCEIVGNDYSNSLIVRKETVNERGNNVKAYREVGDMLFFVMEKGKIIIDLNTGAYTVFEDDVAMDAPYADIFSDTDAFVLLW